MWTGAILTDATVRKADLTWAQMFSISATRVNAEGAILDRASDSGIDLRQSTLFQALMPGIDCAAPTSPRPRCPRPTCAHASSTPPPPRARHQARRILDQASLTRAVLDSASLVRADMPAADLTRAETSEMTQRNVRARGATLTRATLINGSFTGSDLSGASAQGVDLHRTDLFSVAFIGADLRKANLSRTSTHRTVFTCADLRQASLELARNLHDAAWKDTECLNGRVTTDKPCCG